MPWYKKAEFIEDGIFRYRDTSDRHKVQYRWKCPRCTYESKSSFLDFVKRAQERHRIKNHSNHVMDVTHE